MSDFVQAVGAYHRTMQASKGIKPQPALEAAEKSMNILRQGDNIQVIKSAESFPGIVADIVKSQTNTIKAGDRKIAKAIRPTEDGGSEGDILEIMSAVNASEAALQQVITLRDKFVNAYQDIIKMPI